jgi:phosphate acyltransferase
MLTVALDAMGGDHAPKAEVEGAVLAARQLGVKVILVGQEDLVRPELSKYDDWDELPIEVVHASERVTMEDPTKAVRTKRDSSVKVASRLVRDGRAAGLGVGGQHRRGDGHRENHPGRGAWREAAGAGRPLPDLQGPHHPVIVLDVGANVDCSPHMLAQFAVMGEIYARIIVKRDRPRVGLLSIGEEQHKGNDLTRAAWPLLEKLNLNFIGNVEGRDIYGGDVDVVVCDGFTGNVALKVSEGVADLVKHTLRESLEATISAKIGYVFSRTALNDFKKRLDYSEYGGAPLLGVRGVCIISHGRANGKAIRNAIRVASEFSEGQVNQRIEEELRASASEKIAAVKVP